MPVSQAASFNFQEFADAGTPLALGRLYTYTTGTTTQKTAYTDAAGLVPHTYTSDGAGGQYIALNSRGELPAPLYLLTDSGYDLALKRSDGSTVWTRRADGAASASDVGFIQSGTGAVHRTPQDKMREVEVNVKDYAAAVDGSADDIAAWEAACTYVSGLGGGVVSMPQGTSIISRILVVPANVRLRGRGKRGSTIKVSGAFSTGTAVVQLGATTAFAFDCRLEDMAVDCNDRAPIGITGPCIQEGSGARNVLVTRYTATGIDLDETAGTQFADHWLFDDIELYCSSTAASSRGVHYKGLKNGGQIRRLTVNPNGTPADQSAGVHIEGTGAAGCHVNIDGLNVERHTDAVLFDTNGGGIVKNVTLITSGTNVVHIASDKAVVVQYARKVFGTNAIKNDTLSHNITDTEVATYTQVASALGGQAFYANGRTGTVGSVIGLDNPMFTVKTTATSTGAQRCGFQLLDGNNDGWQVLFSGDGTADPLSLAPITAGVVGSAVFGLRDTGAIRNLVSANGPVGTLMLSAAVTTLVGNTSVSGASVVVLTPTNAAAATLMQGTKSLYVSAQVANSSFSVATADGTAAAGTETFNYIVLN